MTQLPPLQVFLFGVAASLAQLAMIAGGVPEWAWPFAHIGGYAFGYNAGRPRELSGG